MNDTPITTPITVLIADDQALVRAGFRALLSRSRDIRVTAEAATGDEAVRAALRERPDVVLMDIHMPGLDGLTAAERVLAALPATRVVVVTTFDTDEHVFRALRVGAAGFLTKEVRGEELRAAVRTVAAGDALLAPGVTRRVIERFAHRPPPPPGGRLPGLTPREHEVLRLVAEGLPNGDIAARLFISPHTVKTHVTNMINKLGLRDRTQLVIAAYDNALVAPARRTRP
ncbi:response regulator transcription factor [Actinomadura sp. ATCC 31491]|uniref:Response regulator transcription factor n=1 Tax=Actinomadura luzonensis TaxID=2805427 RepID=A0ABT0G4E3_9ACTN|nr:response regulator transcription factor [Actinomadura luzonensis]MCK2219477.1 response regulator transcription factor [Actinomadura luzonensis]